MLNKVILMGRLTKDPEIRYTQNSSAVSNFTLAVDRGYTKPGEERQADFVPVIAWKNTAEFVSKYFSKGQLVAVAGRLQTRNWQDNDGKKHFVIEVVADEVHFAEKKQNSAGVQSDTNGFVPNDNDDELPF